MVVHDGNTPVRVSHREQSSTDHAGRAAGVGYADVAMASMAVAFIGSPRALAPVQMAVANSCHETPVGPVECHEVLAAGSVQPRGPHHETVATRAIQEALFTLPRARGLQVSTGAGSTNAA